MLKQKFILNFFSKILLQIIQISAGVIVARVAGPSVLGTVAFGTAYVGSFMFISNLGLGSGHIKLISEGQNEGECIATYSYLKLFTTFTFAIVVIGFFLIQKYIFKFKFESLTHQYIIFISLLVGIVESFLQVPKFTFNANVEVAKSVITHSLRKLIYQILRVFVVILGFGALTISFSKLASFIFVIPIFYYFFKDYSWESINKRLLSKYFSIAFPSLFIMISATLMRTLDKIVIQFFYNSEQVGYYTAGYKIGSLLMMLTAGVTPFFPIFSRAFSNNNFRTIKNKLYRYERFIYIFLMPLVIFIAIYSDSIITLILGKQYNSSVNTMSIITFAMFIRILSKPYSNVLTGKGRFKLVAIISIGQLIIFIGSLFIFIHPSLFALKATGGALGYLSANILAFVIYLYFSKQELSILEIFNNKHFMIFGILNFICFFIFYNQFVLDYGIKFRIAFPFIYFIITYSILILLKWIKKEDLEIFRSMIDWKTMKKYISGEIKNKK